VEYFSPILTGVLFGLGTMIFIGPVFFYLLKSTLEKGPKAGISVAIGIIVGDALCVLLAVLGLSAFFESTENQKWMALIGAILLVVMGIQSIITPKTDKSIVEKVKQKSLFTFFLNGFLVNFINPFVIGIWVALTTIIETKYDSESQVYIALICTLITIFSTDLLKVFFANKLKSFFTPKRLTNMSKIFGMLMIAFSLRLFYSFFQF
jgi:threonine/homoserine/homoserine lactone efflux protein